MVITPGGPEKDRTEIAGSGHAMKKAPDAFRTIGEVAELLQTPAHVLRFWESKFYQIKPVKRAGGRRYYRPDDVALIAGIRHLLQDRGMTIRGVQKLLQEEGVRYVGSMAPPLPSEAQTSEVAGAGTDIGSDESPLQTSAEAPAETSSSPSAETAAPGPIPARKPLTVPPRPTPPSPPPVVPPRLTPVHPRATMDRARARDDDAAPPMEGAIGEGDFGRRAPPPVRDANTDNVFAAPASAREAEGEGAAAAPETTGSPPAAVPDHESQAAPGPSVRPVAPPTKPQAQRPAPQAGAGASGTGSPEPEAGLEEHDTPPAAPRPAQILRGMARGSLGARSERLAILAGRIERLLDRMSEASGSGRW